MQIIRARVQARSVWPGMIVLGALLPRLVFMLISHHPGLWDPIEYYSLAVNLQSRAECILFFRRRSKTNSSN